MTTLKHVDFEVPNWTELAQGPQAWLAHAQAVLQLNPVTYWRLGEATGAVAADQTGSHDGEYRNGVTLGQGGAVFRDADTAVLFNGSNGYLHVPHHAALNLAGASPATWLLWVRKTDPNDDGQRWLLGKGSAQSGALRYLIEARADTGLLQFNTNNGSWHSATSNTGLPFNGWTQVGVVWDGVDTVTFFHNGQPAGSASFNTSWFPATSGALSLGAAHASQLNNNLFHFGGRLDEIAFFNQALAASDVADLYNRAAGVFRLP